MSKFEEILKLKAEYDKMAQEFGAKEIGDHIAWLLNRLDSRIKGVTWKQYVPYFNDGESCTFSVHESLILLDHGVAHSEALEENEDADEDPDGWDRVDPWYFEKYPDLHADMQKLVDAVNDIPSDIKEAAFGEHAEIRITRKGVDYDAYTDHD